MEAKGMGFVARTGVAVTRSALTWRIVVPAPNAMVASSLRSLARLLVGIEFGLAGLR
jgi:hypothetical protein